MRPGPEFCHRAQVPLLQRGETIKTYSKEAFVKRADRLDRSLLNVCDRDRTSLRNVPSVLAPLLQEIRITPCVGNDSVHGVSRKIHSLGLGGFHERLARVVVRQRTDLGVIEKPFSV